MTREGGTVQDVEEADMSPSLTPLVWTGCTGFIPHEQSSALGQVRQLNVYSLYFSDTCVLSLFPRERLALHLSIVEE